MFIFFFDFALKDFKDNLVESTAHAWEHTKEVFVPTYVADCAIWPFLQYVNFKFVPLHYQALYVNVCNLGWNTFLSFMANSHHGMS